MPASAPDELIRALPKMEAEARSLTDQLKRLQTLITATKEYARASRGVHGTTSGAVARPSTVAARSSRPKAKATAPAPIADAIVAVMKQGGSREWTPADIAAELAKRGVVAHVGGSTNDRVRKSLNRLARRKMVSSRREGKDRFARTMWKVAR